MSKYLFVTLAFLISANYLLAIERTNDSDYGLFIKSSPVNNSQKTTLVLENNSPLKLKKETTLSFDMYIRKEYIFGTVFRIITNKKENIDLMFTMSDNSKRYPILVINESAHIIPQEVITDRWIPVSITLSKKDKNILFTYDKTKLTVPYDISNTSNAKIAFGVCPFESYKTTDIASVNIRDIKIIENKDLIRCWKLKQHNKNIVLDSLANVPALLTNPCWIIDIYSTWEKIYSNKVLFNTLFTFDKDSKFYIVSPDSKSIKIFDTKNKTENIIQAQGGCAASNKSPNMIFFDSASNKIVTYNLDESVFSEFSFKTNTWSFSKKPTKDPGYLNNSAVYSPVDFTLYSFGGYGHYKYNHDLIKMNLSDGIQKKIEFTGISPRFSASTVIVGNTMYIFGGRGSKSGRQEILPRNYYDLYSVNLLLGQANKLWENTEVKEDFFPSENMIFDKEKNCFYAFTTQGGGTLLKIEKEKKGFEKMSFPIGLNFDAYYFFTNIYYSPSQKKLFALVYKQTTETTVDVSIYALNFPPVPIDSLNQVPSSGRSLFQSRTFLLWGIMMVLIICFALILLWKKKKPSGQNELNENTNTDSFKSDEQVHSKEDNQDEKFKMHEQDYYDFSKSSICFLNRFTVIDKDGNNITRQFSPTLKYLLILLILNTEKDSNGIFGKKLTQLLWLDKNEKSAGNNRNVYLSKLRSTLENVGDVEILSKNGSWTVQFNENITCDYTEAMKLFTVIKEEDNLNHAQINRLLELLLRGVLLPDIEEDWIDSFKSDFSNLTIDVLTKLYQRKEYQLNDELRLKISDTLFLHDIINEEALYIKCTILFNSGKKGIAKSIYDNFCKDYYNLLGETYKYSLTDVINRININDK